MLMSVLIRVTGYLGSYSKQQLVRVIYGFNKEGKLTEFIFAPVEVQKQEQK